MALTSGGTTFRWRRKRSRAARLRPVAEDAASTTQLFNGNGRARPGTHLPLRRRVTAPEPDRQPHRDGVNGADGPTAPSGGPLPLVRYEWRSTSGETLVVEAGWPVPEPPVRADGAVAPSPEPRVDLRS